MLKRLFRKKYSYLLLAFYITLLFFIGNGKVYGAPEGCVSDSCPEPLLGILDVVPVIINVILVLSISVFFIILVVDGYNFITAGGDSDKIKDAQKSIIFSMLGFGLVFGAFLILQIVARVTGVNSGFSILPGSGNIAVSIQTTYTPTPVDPRFVHPFFTSSPPPPGGGGDPGKDVAGYEGVLKDNNYNCGYTDPIDSSYTDVNKDNCIAFYQALSDGDRNTRVLPDLAEGFVVRVESAFNLPDAEYGQMLNEVYDVSTKYDINPLYLIGIWNAENGMNYKDNKGNVLLHPFNCKDKHTSSGWAEGFKNSLDCFAYYINFYMDATDFVIPKYDRLDNNSNVPTGGSCTFDEAFAYAYDWLTPVCHFHDGNGHARYNFVTAYMKVKGS